MCVALFAVAFGSNVPPPLPLIYQQRSHPSAAALTAMFGAYAVDLVPELLVSGPVSDRLGLRRPRVPFVALVSTGLFLPAADVVWLLFVARFPYPLQGCRRHQPDARLVQPSAAVAGDADP